MATDEIQELTWAATIGDVETAEELLAHGADPNALDRFGTQILGVAATYGHVEIARLLLDYGADINAQDKSGYTALINAAAVGDADMVDALIQAGANTQLRDDEGRTALYYAESQGFSEVTAMLQRAAADQAKPKAAAVRGGIEELALAVTSGDIDTVQMLMESVDINRTDEKGNSLLGLAATYSQLEIAGLLLDNGADVNFQDHHGYTPLHNAVARGDTDMVDRLLQYGANTQLRDNAGKSASYYADTYGFPEISAMLQRAAADQTRQPPNRVPRRRYPIPSAPQEPAAAKPKRRIKHYKM